MVEIFLHKLKVYIVGKKKDVQFLEGNANKRETSRLHSNRFLDERC